MIYAVIDTNVVVSALISHNPSAATVLVMERLFKGEITPVYNEEILDEYNEVLHRAKFKLIDEDIQVILDYIKHFGMKVNRKKYIGSMPDEKDRPFYEVSLRHKDSYLVTGNIRHFPSTPRVVSPAELMDLLDSSIQE